MAPPRLCAISLGQRDGLVVLAKWVTLRGRLAAIFKALLQLYFVHFLPLPYWLMRRLPGKQPRRMISVAGPSDGVVELARSGGEGLARRKTFAPSAMRELEANRGVRAPAVRPAPNSAEKPVDAEPAAALIVAFAAAVAAATLGVSRIALVGL